MRPAQALFSFALFPVLLAGVVSCSSPETAPGAAATAPAAAPAPVPAPAPAPPPPPAPAAKPTLPEMVILDGTMLKHVSGSWRLTPEGLERIHRIAELAAAPDSRWMLDVVGFSSSTGTHARNLALSHQRAEAVAHALVHAGVPLDRIHIEGLGADRPVADNTTHEGRIRNQRVEISFRAP